VYFKYNNVKSKIEGWLADISNNGGNAIRIWLHIDGQHSPQFDSQGIATGSDTQSLITELGQFLDACQKHNLFAIIVLWNGAVEQKPNMKNLLTDEKKLQAYIDKVLTPMAKGLASKKALGAWEIINEPEGSLKVPASDSNNCFSTQKLSGTGAGWANVNFNVKDVLKFINWQAAAIKTAAPGVLVTGGGSEHTITDKCSNCFNYYSDACLTAAGGKSKGTIDFYQVHSYTWQGKFSDFSPFKAKESAYGLNKPLIVGEFSTACSESNNAATNYKLLYDSGYAGALSWQYNEGGDCTEHHQQSHDGMKAIMTMTNNGVVKVTI